MAATLSRPSPKNARGRRRYLRAIDRGLRDNSDGFIRANGEIRRDIIPVRRSVPGAIFVNLWDINDAGDAVGEVTTSGSPNFDSHSFLYRDGVITPLPNYPGADKTRVFSINNRGEMTGMIIENNNQTGFILKDGQFNTFRILGSLAFTPFGINDKGDVTGSYFVPENFEGTSFIRRAK